MAIYLVKPYISCDRSRPINSGAAVKEDWFRQSTKSFQRFRLNYLKFTSKRITTRILAMCRIIPRDMTDFKSLFSIAIDKIF